MKKVLFFGLIVVFVAFVLWFATIETDGEFEEWVLRWGYLGFFGAAFLGGFNFAFPSFHLALIVPFLNAGLEIWALVLLAALGTTLADSVGYALGRSGGAAFSSLARVRKWGEGVVVKYPRLAPVILFAWISLVPVPNEIFVIPAGLIRYGFWKTLLIAFAGNVIFNFLVLNFGNLFV